MSITKISLSEGTFEAFCWNWGHCVKNTTEMTTENKLGIKIRWCRYLHVDEVAKPMEPWELSSWPRVPTHVCMILITLHSNRMFPEINEIQ